MEALSRKVCSAAEAKRQPCSARRYSAGTAEAVQHEIPCARITIEGALMCFRWPRGTAPKSTAPGGNGSIYDKKVPADKRHGPIIGAARGLTSAGSRS